MKKELLANFKSHTKSIKLLPLVEKLHERNRWQLQLDKCRTEVQYMRYKQGDFTGAQLNKHWIWVSFHHEHGTKKYYLEN